MAGSDVGACLVDRHFHTDLPALRIACDSMRALFALSSAYGTYSQNTGTHYCKVWCNIMGPKEIYLTVYNVSLCVCWTLIYTRSLRTVAEGVFDGGLAAALSTVYASNGVATLLTYAQTAALLEIVHAGLGLVRSPVLVTAMQVGSRIVALVAVNGSVEAQSKCL